MSVFRILLCAAGFLLALAAGFRLAPLHSPSEPTAPLDEAAPAMKADLSSLTTLFDRTRLPPRKQPQPVQTPPPPPPDPAAGLRRYRFIGLAASNDRTAGIFEGNGATIVLGPGAALEGFILKQVSANGAVFTNNNQLEINLSLEHPRVN